MVDIIWIYVSFISGFVTSAIALYVWITNPFTKKEIYYYDVEDLIEDSKKSEDEF